MTRVYLSCLHAITSKMLEAVALVRCLFSSWVGQVLRPTLFVGAFLAHLAWCAARNLEPVSLTRNRISNPKTWSLAIRSLSNPPMWLESLVPHPWWPIARWNARYHSRTAKTGQESAGPFQAPNSHPKMVSVVGTPNHPSFVTHLCCPWSWTMVILPRSILDGWMSSLKRNTFGHGWGVSRWKPPNLAWGNARKCIQSHTSWGPPVVSWLLISHLAIVISATISSYPS